jgi:hypothetical protein
MDEVLIACPHCGAELLPDDDQNPANFLAADNLTVAFSLTREWHRSCPECLKDVTNHLGRIIHGYATLDQAIFPNRNVYADLRQHLAALKFHVTTIYSGHGRLKVHEALSECFGLADGQPADRKTIADNHGKVSTGYVSQLIRQSLRKLRSNHNSWRYQTSQYQPPSESSKFTPKHDGPMETVRFLDAALESTKAAPWLNGKLKELEREYTSYM